MVLCILLGPLVGIGVAHAEEVGWLGYVAGCILGLLAGIVGSFCSLKLEDLTHRQWTHRNGLTSALAALGSLLVPRTEGGLVLFPV